MTKNLLSDFNQQWTMLKKHTLPAVLPSALFVASRTKRENLDDGTVQTNNYMAMAQCERVRIVQNSDSFTDETFES